MTDPTIPTRPTKPSRFGSIGLRTKMLLLFGSLFAVVFLAELLIDVHGLPFTEIGGEYEMQQEEVFRNLNLIADLKKDQLMRWIQDRKADAVLVAEEEHLSLTVTKLIANFETKKALKRDPEQLWPDLQHESGYDQLQDHLKRIQLAHSDFQSVSILEPTTLICIASSQNDKVGQIHENFVLGSSQFGFSLGPFVSDIGVDEPAGRPSFHLVSAIRRYSLDHSLQTEVIGLVVIQMDLDNVITPILYTGSGLGKSGEVLLVDQKGTLLTHLKHPLADGSVAKPLQYVIEDEPATRAAMGSEGLIRAVDYRGEPVLAAYRHLRISPEIGWGMITKIDESEVYAQITKKLSLNYAVSFIGLLFVLGMVLLISRNLSRPIIKLSKASEQITAGELSARVDYTGSDEFGLLSSSFNSMADRIQRWHEELEQQVHSRTTELKSKNQELLGEIAERKQAEEALTESEWRMSSHLQNTPIVVIEWNCDFEVTEWNAAAERVFGYTRDEALGRHAAGLIVPETAKEHVDKVWSDLLKNSGGFHSENENFTKDGRTIVCDWNNTPLIDESGKVYGVASLVQDITERKRAEERLKRSEEKYREVLEKTDTGFVLVDEVGAVVEANEPYLRLLGVDQLDDIIGRSVLEWTAPESLEENSAAVALCAKQGYIKDFETTYLRSDGTRVTIQINAIMQETSEGKRLSAQCRDITERKRIEEELRESEEKYRNLAETSHDLIWKCDAAGRFTYLNPAWERTHGYSNEEMLGRPFTDFQTRETAAVAVEEFGRHLEGGSVIGYDTTHINKSGKTIHLVFNAMPLLDSEGNVVGTQGTAIDTTELKRLQELESRAQRLETAGTIAGQVAHDFNNLLAPLMAYPDFIREELPEDHPALQYLDDIEESAQKIADINQDLLAMGRRGHYNQEVLNLNKVVRRALTELEPYDKTLVCQVDLSDDLMDILGGGAQLHRVINNLLHNAKDAMRNIGQITVKTENYYVDDISIVYGRVPKGEYVKLTISDTGCGIPDDIVQKIFDPFFTSKTTEKKRGSGLGLSVVDAVIRDHNGFIDLSTKVGAGTSFYIYLPITRETTARQGSAEIRCGSETILIVDDDDVQREVSSKILSRLGYEIDAVNSGEKAIESLREKPRDLIILDMIMPDGIDGAETFRQILKINPVQKAIILSGFSESARVLEAQKLGAGAFVKKPVTKQVIAAAVRTELDRKVASATTA